MHFVGNFSLASADLMNLNSFRKSHQYIKSFAVAVTSETERESTREDKVNLFTFIHITTGGQLNQLCELQLFWPVLTKKYLQWIFVGVPEPAPIVIWCVALWSAIASASYHSSLDSRNEAVSCGNLRTIIAPSTSSNLTLSLYLIKYMNLFSCFLTPEEVEVRFNIQLISKSIFSETLK